MNTARHTLADMALFDLLNRIWIPIAQSGFSPADDDGSFGRYNFCMDYERLQNQVIVFGGQSNKGTFCKPVVHVFQLPNWIVGQDPSEYEIEPGTLTCKKDMI